MDTKIRTELDKLFQGLEVDDNTKNTIIGIYIISLYKEFIDVLLQLKNNDQVFLITLNDLISKNIETLPEEKRGLFTKNIEVKKKQVLIEIFQTISGQLSDEEAKIFKTNIDTLINSEKESY